MKKTDKPIADQHHQTFECVGPNSGHHEADHFEDVLDMVEIERGSKKLVKNK